MVVNNKVKDPRDVGLTVKQLAVDGKVLGSILGQLLWEALPVGTFPDRMNPACVFREACMCPEGLVGRNTWTPSIIKNKKKEVNGLVLVV